MGCCACFLAIISQKLIRCFVAGDSDTPLLSFIVHVPIMKVEATPIEVCTLSNDSHTRGGKLLGDCAQKESTVWFKGGDSSDNLYIISMAVTR